MIIDHNPSQQDSVKIHEAHCDVWATPEMSSPDVLLTAGYEDEATIAYLASVSPLYAALSRILAQYSGILLLAMTDTRTIVGLDQGLWRSAQDQLAEADDRLQSVEAPAVAIQHWHALNSIAKGLKTTAVKLDRVSVHHDPTNRKENITVLLKQLQSIQRLLIATAEPDANITPVDFESACCTCRTLSPVS